MRDKAKRFARIQALRTRVLDVADAELARLRSSLKQNREMVDAMQNESAAWLASVDGAGHPWSEQQALIRAVGVRSAQLGLERLELKMACARAEANRAHALLAREQAAQMMKDAQHTEALERGRREQAALDDAFVAASRRRTSPNLF